MFEVNELFIFHFCIIPISHSDLVIQTPEPTRSHTYNTVILLEMRAMKQFLFDWDHKYNFLLIYGIILFEFLLHVFIINKVPCKFSIFGNIVRMLMILPK